MIQELTGEVHLELGNPLQQPFNLLAHNGVYVGKLLIPVLKEMGMTKKCWQQSKRAYLYLLAPAEGTYASRRAACAPRAASHTAVSGRWCKPAGIYKIRKKV